MNATPLPTPLSGPSAAPAPNSARPRAGETGQASQFEQHLAREVDLRQGGATAPAGTAGPANNTVKQQPPALGRAAASVRAGEQAAAAPSILPAGGKIGAEAGEAGKIADAGFGSDEESIAPSNPMVDLINLVASFNQPAALAARPALAGSAGSASVASAAQGTDETLSTSVRSVQTSLQAPGLAGVTDTNRGQTAATGVGAASAKADGGNEAIDTIAADWSQVPARAQGGAAPGEADAGGEATDTIAADWSKVPTRAQGGAAPLALASASPSQGERGMPPPIHISAPTSAARIPEGRPPDMPVTFAVRPGERAAAQLPDRAARSEGPLLPQAEGTVPRPEHPLSASNVAAQAVAPSAAQTAGATEMQVARTDSAALVARAVGSASDAAAMAESGPAAPLAGPQPQSALGAMNPAAGLVAADKIPARVGTPAWDNQVAQKVVWMVAGDEQSATMTLNPPDMGPMQIVLSVTNDQASVTFSSATPEVRQALEDALPKLREMMSESGVSLGEATVNDGRDEQRQAQESGQRQRNGHGSGAGNGRGGDIPPEPARPPRRGGTEGLVDTFA